MTEADIQVLLVQPDYYTRYPPLGLLKLASLHGATGHSVVLVRGLQQVCPAPDLIYITSLFTYSWRPVHEASAYYRSQYPEARVVLGGIYATLMPEHARLSGVDEVHKGLVLEAEGFRPDYSLVPEWNSSIMFGTRGCIRKCAFCAVPRLEGKTWGPAHGIADLVHPDHKKVVLWDNNILGVPNWRDVVAELRELKVEVDFNQGLDARLINDDVAHELSGLRINPIRMAYDIPGERRALERAIPALEAAGFNRRRMIVYTLYNFTDTREDFLNRVVDLLSWGVVSYPMRYEPLNSLVKNKCVSPHWTARQLEMVASARWAMVEHFRLTRASLKSSGTRHHLMRHSRCGKGHVRDATPLGSQGPSSSLHRIFRLLYQHSENSSMTPLHSCDQRVAKAVVVICIPMNGHSQSKIIRGGTLATSARCAIQTGSGLTDCGAPL